MQRCDSCLMASHNLSHLKIFKMSQGSLNCHSFFGAFCMFNGRVWQDNDNRLYDNNLFVVLGMIIFFIICFFCFCCRGRQHFKLGSV